MRLFIALELEPKIHEYLDKYTVECKKRNIKASFTYIDNYHVTLIFLGEQPETRVDSIIKAIEATSQRFKPFDISCGQTGTFKAANGGKTLWAGVKDNGESEKIYIELSEQLKNHNFKIENRKYKPHITLARNLFLKQNEFLPELNEISSHVDGITLFESIRGKGRMIYNALYFSKFSY